MSFDIPPLTPCKILELAARGIEGIPDSHIKVPVRFTIHDEIRPRNGQFDPDLVESPLPLVSMGNLNLYPAADQPGVIDQQPARLFFDRLSGDFGERQVSRRDLDRKRHRPPHRPGLTRGTEQSLILV